MNPGFVLVCDPRPGQARSRVAAILDTLGVPVLQGRACPSDMVAESGSSWAAAAIAPPVDESTCGSDIYQAGGLFQYAEKMQG